MHTLLCCSLITQHALVSAPGKPFFLTQEAGKMVKEEKSHLDDLTISNFSCTHKSGVGEGGGAAGTVR